MEKPIEGFNMREVLGENLFLIRFPTMTVDEFDESVLSLDILTSHEGLQVLHYLTAKSTKPRELPFSTELRCSKSQQSAMVTIQQTPADSTPRFLTFPPPHTESIAIGPFEDHRSTRCFQTSLECQINRPIQLNVISIHSALSDSKISYSLTVYLTQNGRTLYNHTEESSYDHHVNTPITHTPYWAVSPHIGDTGEHGKTWEGIGNDTGRSGEKQGEMGRNGEIGRKQPPPPSYWPVLEKDGKIGKKRE